MPSRPLTLGISPCPNDTFIFHALVHDKLPGAPAVSARLEDVETLNQLARQGSLDLTKVSYHALGHLRQDYVLLDSGGALGRGCGPLVVAQEPTSMQALKGRPIAIPGELTTANLLLQLYGEGFEQAVSLPFDRIMPAVITGEVAAGVIIHESRFTFTDLGLHQVLDLGTWWEKTTGCPIPLGGILAKRSLGRERIRVIDQAVRRSVEYAWQHPEESRPYIKAHAQELADEVIEQHIDLYVNAFSRSLGDQGHQAVHTLFQRAEARGIIPPSNLPLFID